MDIEEFEAPFKRMAARNNWDPPADADGGELFSGFNEKYADRSGFAETRTEEGDRIVNPSQNIKLDDSEFGRY